MTIRAFFLIASCSLAPAALADSLFANTYPISAVREIVVGGGAVVEIQQGDAESLRAEAAKDVLERVVVDVTGQRMTLKVKSKEDGFFSWFDLDDDEVKFVISAKDLSLLELSGGVHAHIGDRQGAKLTLDLGGSSHAAIGKLDVASLVFELSGAAHVVVKEVNGVELKADLSGATHLDITGKGKLDHLHVELSGASQYQSRGVTSTTVVARASGASHIELRVSDSLEAEASGASHIDYYGNPRVQQQSSGASNIQSHAD